MANLGEDGQDWSAWEAALDTGKSPKLDSEILSGYWRLESANATAAPVVTYFEGPMIQIRIAGGDIIDSDLGEPWHRFCTTTWPRLKAVDYEDFQTATETGFWPDGCATSKRDAIGANEGPEDAVEKLLAESRANLAKAQELVKGGPAKTQRAADAAAVLVGTLASAKAQLLEYHKAEKEPHLEAGRRVDARFLPLTKDMNAIAISVRKDVSEAFLKEKERIAKLAAEAAQKVLDDAAAAEREVEIAAAKEKGEPISDEQWQEAAPKQPAVTVTAAKVTSGTKGARVTLKNKRYGIITDMEAFAVALVKMKSHELIAVLEQAATRLARSDFYANSPDGTVICDGLKLEIRREA